MRFKLEVRLLSALERAVARLQQPFLQAVHTEAVLALLTLHGMHQNSMANPTLYIVREHIVIGHSLDVDNRKLKVFIIIIGLFSILALIVTESSNVVLAVWVLRHIS